MPAVFRLFLPLGWLFRFDSGGTLEFLYFGADCVEPALELGAIDPNVLLATGTNEMLLGVVFELADRKCVAVAAAGTGDVHSFIFKHENLT